MASGPNLFQIKRTAVAGRAANTVTLPNPGELAINMIDQILYSTNGEVVFEIGANVANQVVRTGLVIGNDSVNTTSNSTQINTEIIQLGTAVYVGGNVDVTVSGLYIGNTTANLIANSIIVSVANSTGTSNLQPTQLVVGTSVTNTTVHASGANVILSTTDLKIGNSTANIFSNSILISVSNSTATANLQPTQLVVGTSTINTTVVAAGANVIANTSTLYIGNSTVNAIANSLAFVLSNSTVTFTISKPTVAQVSDGQYYLAADSTWKQVVAGATPAGANTEIQYNLSGSLGANANFIFDYNTTRLTVGNSTVNVSANSMQITLANSTVNTHIAVPTSVQYSATNYFLHANGSWVEIVGGEGSVYVYQKFTATGGQTDFTIAGGFTPNEVQVYENGVHLANDEYTANGTHVVLGTGALAGAIIEVTGYIALSSFTPTAGGSDTYIQFNDATSLGGTAGFTFTKATNNVFIANTLTIGSATINSTKYSQTANNADYLGGTAAAGYQTTAGLAANVATLDANNAAYLGGIAAAGWANLSVATFTTTVNVGANIQVSTTRLLIGNSTANLNANSILVSVANSTGTSNLQPTQLVIGTSTVNTTALVAGANAYLNTTQLFVGNSTANLNANSILVSVSNSTSTANLQPTQLVIGSATVNSTAYLAGANVYLDTVKMFAGNSTANLTANSIIVSVSNSTATSNLQPTQLVIGSSTVNTTAYVAGANVFLNTTTLSVGNSTANLLANSILVSVANSTGTANLQPTQLILGSSIVNSTVITSGGSLLSANVQVNPQTGTTYTLAAGDSGKIVTMDNGSPMTVTVPAGLPIGFRCQVLRLGAGTCTLSNTGQTGCTILSRTSAFAITARYGSASVFQTATANTYIVDGLVALDRSINRMHGPQRLEKGGPTRIWEKMASFMFGEIENTTDCT